MRMMIRGFMKTTSLTTLVAAAGIFVGNSAYAPAIAADLGGGCCADLEERVAELEATTARKGNRVVSLQIYGQVNKALLIWDDGEDSDVYVVDNDESGSRIGLQGSATMRPGWTAGYVIEFNYQDAASNDVTQFDDDADENDISIRKNELYVESERLGRVTIGQGSSASDGIAEIVLAGVTSDSNPDYGNDFFVLDNLGVSTGLTNDDFVNGLDGLGRNDRVRYDSPSIYGFILSSSWGEDDNFDIALRFKKEWNSIRLAAGIAYAEVSEDDGDLDQISGSISIMHVPTGLYGAFAAGELDEEGFEEADFWYGQLGIEKRWFAHGATTIYVEYGDYNDFASGIEFLSGGLVIDTITSSEATLWGFGIVQKYDSAALEIYGKVNFYDFDAVTDTGVIDLTDLQDQTFVLIGSRIKF